MAGTAEQGCDWRGPRSCRHHVPGRTWSTTDSGRPALDTTGMACRRPLVRFPLTVIATLSRPGPAADRWRRGAAPYRPDTRIRPDAALCTWAPRGAACGITAQTDRPLTACAIDQRTADPAPGVEVTIELRALAVRIPQDLETDAVEDPIRAVPVAKGDQRTRPASRPPRYPASRLPAGPGARRIAWLQAFGPQ